MLARDYDYEKRWNNGYSDSGGPAYEPFLPEYEQDEQNSEKQKHVRKGVRWSRKGIQRAVSVAFVALAIVYGFSVFRSSDLRTATNELISLQNQEMQLKNSNEALSIEVEKLKSPGRITAIATNELGMKVARNNIYVKGEK